MSLIVLGLSHKTAPLELREQLTIPTEKLSSSFNSLHSSGQLKETVILSTCNRLEVYARPQAKNKDSLEALAKFFESLYPHPQLPAALYRLESFDAIHHLFRVSCGLDSMVVGESEILGQVKTAYLLAQQHHATGKITNVLFQRALYVGKQVRTRTHISEGSSSVGSIAVQLAERIFGDLSRHKVLLIGAGKMAEVTVRHLLSQKVSQLTILNRTLERALELAKLLNAQAGSIEKTHAELLTADIVICSTSSDRPLITHEFAQMIMKERNGRSLYFIDIAVPRNVEPAVHHLDNVYVYNLDDLKAIVDEHLSKRKTKLERAETEVKLMAQDFFEWMKAALEGREHSLRHNSKPTRGEVS